MLSQRSRRNLASGPVIEKHDVILNKGVGIVMTIRSCVDEGTHILTYRAHIPIFFRS